MVARFAATIFATVALLATGCSYNPARFPFVLPPGRIEPTHAKPRAWGYFRDFDPKAKRLEVRPSGSATAPLGAQIVLVATVYDSDGQPRRNRRVEWMIDGPGYIVEADESGLFAGRGYKVDNKYAVTFTSYIPKKITRGNDDEKDDVAIEPGQTFIVLSSALAGETVVTAYAPEVFNWDQGRVVTKVVWGDGRFSFPTPVAARVGGETTLSTRINTLTADTSGPFRVRYRVLDGPPTLLVAPGGDTSFTGNGRREAETLTDDNGEASVRLLQRDPQVGKTRVAVEVVKPSDNGLGPGTVVGRHETVVVWARPELKLKIEAPPVANTTGAFPATIWLDNVSAVESQEARVRVTLSDGATLVRSEPPPTRMDENGGLIFDLPPVAGKAKQGIVLQVRPARIGEVTVTAEAVTGDGLQATTSASTRIENGKLQLVLDVPPLALAGERVPVRIAVTNTGAAPVENVIVWGQFDDGLTHADKRSPVEIPGGTIKPGETKTFDLPLTARTTGRSTIRATATGDGRLTATAEAVAVEIRRAELTATITGPQLAYLHQQMAWSLVVANRGDATLKNGVVRATLPPELRLKTASGAAVGPGSIEWKVSSLAPNEQKTFTLTAEAVQLTPQASIAVVALADAAGHDTTIGTPVETKAEATLAVIGTPALSLELASSTGITEVGKPVKYQIRLKNQGTVSARRIDVTATASPELKPTRATGSGDGRCDTTGRVVFPTVEELAPGATLTWTIEADTIQIGLGRFQVEVHAAHLKSPLKEEQATRVTPR
ncbi:MAG: hypothetical protein RMJ56_08815 [Gemmataceae bacterium]|nr:hypothetical protein [Gemmata sp.]MDW8197687.1 hypothetical protein [Gemmataceae bacterium]